MGVWGVGPPQEYLKDTTVTTDTEITAVVAA